MKHANTRSIEKYTLTIKEAAAYYGIGQKKLRKLCEFNLYNGFAIYSGNRYLLIRNKFEEFLERTEAI